jgi:demethylmenaquinone methyltransferase/2-methoxy-6-polyprenyl-1,4-benzoquinol methylase
VEGYGGDAAESSAGRDDHRLRRRHRRARAVQLRRGGADARIVVVDYSPEMVAAGVERGGAPEIVWSVGDAQNLPLPDACAEAYIIAFGIRNVADISRALSEARRVLKPGGRFLCLEFSRPVTEALRAAYDAYSFKVIPQVGEWVAKDREAYQYLVESIRRFPDQAAFAELMRQAGFDRVGWTNFTGGVCALHQGWALQPR